MPTASDNSRSKPGAPTKRGTLLVYFVAVLVYSLAGFFPEMRLWGINWWAYYPTAVRLVMPAIALLGGILVWRFSGARSSEGDPAVAKEMGTGQYTVITAATVMIMGLTFVAFRTQTHFLGDGYQLLSSLADNVTSVKAWDFGVSRINLAVYSVLGEGGQNDALLAYRIISIGSGVLLLGAVAFLSSYLFAERLLRILFLLGIACSGLMLQYFGYVENYSLLMTILAIFALLGMLSARGRFSSWWLLAPLLAAVFLHGFALVAVPPFLYLVIRRCSLWSRLSAVYEKSRVWWIVGGLIVAGGVYVFLRAKYYFFTFALLPVFPDRFTVESDWLFSWKHQVDIANLMLLLLPGLPVVSYLLLKRGTVQVFGNVEQRFLGMFFWSAFVAVYVFNPGIGMPRNWDLFSVAGVPLVIFSLTFLLQSHYSVYRSTVPAVLVILLGAFMLIPRVGSQTIPKMSIAHFDNYLEFDKIRNRNAHRLLIDYYYELGDTASALAAQSAAEAGFPEMELTNEGRRLMQQGRITAAMRLFRQAIDSNPIYYDAYANLGGCYLEQGNYDSAVFLLEIADAINPYNPATASNLGTAHLRQGNYDRARTYFQKAIRIDSTWQNALVGLASVHLLTDEPARSFEFLRKAHRNCELPHEYFRQAGDVFLEKELFEYAYEAYAFAMERGLPESYVQRQMNKHPRLRRIERD